MNNQDNKIIISVLANLFAGIALVYTLIQYHDTIFAVLGVSAIFLITAFILTQNILVWITMRSKSNSVQIKSLADDISMQLENMSSSQAAIGKSTYAYTKQTAKIITGLDEKYTDSQEALFKSLSTIASNNNKATKLIVKYTQNNTSKMVASMKELRTQLNDILTQGFDQIQPDNTEVIDTLNALVTYLKSQQNNGMDSAMGLQLNNVAHELQNISNSIQHFQMPVATMVPTMQPQPTVQQPVVNVAAPVAPSPEGTPLEAVNTIEEALQADSMLQQNDVAEEQATLTDINEAMEEIPPEEVPTPEENQTVEAPADVAEAPIPEETIAVAEATVTEEIAEETSAPVDSSAENAVEATEEVAEATEEFKPTFTVISNDEAPAEEAPVLDDPNKQLSADEIAALFAAADSTPAKTEPVAEATPATEPVAEAAPAEEAPVLDDPNKQLSADEIAALFAAAEPAPAKAEPAAEAAPAEEAPVLDDPNKQLSADEIAALFAAAEPAPAKEPEPAPEPVSITPVSDDPNKQLSADEIAALFAQMG